jgi:succinate dehydrogenase / fumarate reductase cytochrome b subunit
MSTVTPEGPKKLLSDEESKLPKPFVMRRLQSFLGIWLSLYLFVHLLVNSQAALFFFDDGSSFIALVNQLEDLPFLPIVEWIVIGLPFLVHGIWGILYIRSSKPNAHPTDGSSPTLPQYPRNKAYTWQRITAMLLVFGVVFHVIQMRFLERPAQVFDGPKTHHYVSIKEDKGLGNVLTKVQGTIIADKEGKKVIDVPTMGGALFLVLRETFKSPLMVILYSLFVIVACYHAFNGLWTFMITWGITLTRHSQKRMRTVATSLMTLTIILGLMAIWGTYWTTLFQI